MTRSVRDIVNDELIRKLGISYDEYEKLDIDEQQRLISDYHKKHFRKRKNVTIMIGGGDDSIFMNVPKGKKILTPNGYYIAGETLEENKKRWEDKILLEEKGMVKKLVRTFKKK